MHATPPQFDIQAIQTNWQGLYAVTHLRSVHNEDDYDQMVSLMNFLIETAGDDDDHPLSDLLDIVGDLVSTYEQKHYAIEPWKPDA
ncbi:hypothetical protein ACVBEF_05855 [Glaciimonas sp. GG7]